MTSFGLSDDELYEDNNEELDVSFSSNFVGEDIDFEYESFEIVASDLRGSIQNDDFVLAPIEFNGMPPSQNNGPNSFAFNHIVKKTNEYLLYKQIQSALEDLRNRHDTYRGLISIQRDVPYFSNQLSNDKQKLDIYTPKDAGITLHNLPLVIHFHGGGWVRGDRRDELRGAPAACRQYSRNGIVAVAPSYRLRNCPGHMEDAVAAVHWVIKHAKTLGANTKVIFLSGHSAGRW